MIRCPNCGTHMEENEVKCPLCGEPVVKENTNSFSDNPFSNPNTSFANDPIFQSPKVETSSFFSKNQTQTNHTKKTFFDNKPEVAPASSDKKQIYLLVIIVIVFIAIVGGIILLTKSGDKNKAITDESNKIELSGVGEENQEGNDNEKNPGSEEPTEPETPPTENPEEPEGNPEPTEKQVTIGKYVVTIPEGYNVTQDDSNVVTLGDADTGYIITIEPGPYNIKKYRANDDELKKSYEAQNATVERIYDDKITSHDVHILEVEQEGTKFLIAITPSINNRAYILTILNGFQKDAYDYGALTEALSICDNIKLSN